MLINPAALEYYYDHPVEFIRECILVPARRSIPGIDMTPDQIALANAINSDNRVAIESGHGTGKSTALAWIALWFLITRHNKAGNLTKIPCIAPTYHQLQDILFPEFNRWIPISLFSELLTVQKDEVFVNGSKDNSFIRARSPKKPDAVQGFHASHLLWICDEAFGITDDMVWETIEGSLTEADNRIIIAGQHTVIVGYCHSAFHRDRDEWSCLRFDSSRSPLAKKSYCDRIARKYGLESDVYRVRVLGQEPKGNPDSFIQLSDVEMARNREVEGNGTLCIGLDCARFGDDMTCLTIRNGFHVYPQVTLAQSDTDDIVALVVTTLRKYRKLTGIQSRCDVKVDNSGGWGAGAIDTLNKNTTDNIRVVPVNSGGKVASGEYYDRVSWLWGQTKSVIHKIQIEDCLESDYLVEELSTRRYSMDGSGRIRIEPKSEFKKRYGDSPDRADSLILCLATQADEQRVWADYLSTDERHRGKVDIKWDSYDPETVIVMGAMVMDRDYGISGAFFLWDRRDKTLTVYAEYEHRVPVAREIAESLERLAGCKIGDRQSNRPVIKRIYCNKEMQRGGADQIAQLRKSGIRVYCNPKSDESGAVMVVNDLFRSAQIMLSDECIEMDEQIRGWTVVNGVPQAGFPLCRALCIVVSELREMDELKEPDEMQPYSYKKKSIRETLRKMDVPSKNDTDDTNQYDWMAQ